MIIVSAIFNTIGGHKSVELVRARVGESVAAKAKAALDDLYARKKRDPYDFVKTETEEIKINVKDCFDHRGQLIPESDVDFLFDAFGLINDDISSEIRSYMMQPGRMPLACTDLARLFFAVEAQRIANLPAETFFKK